MYVAYVAYSTASHCPHRSRQHPRIRPQPTSPLAIQLAAPYYPLYLLASFLCERILSPVLEHSSPFSYTSLYLCRTDCICERSCAYLLACLLNSWVHQPYTPTYTPSHEPCMLPRHHNKEPTPSALFVSYILTHVCTIQPDLLNSTSGPCELFNPQDHHPLMT